MSKQNNSGFTLIEIVLVVFVVGLIGFAGYQFMQARERKAEQGTPTTSGEQSAESKPAAYQLCYLGPEVTCYKDQTLAATEMPDTFKDLTLQRILPSPKGDKLAVIAGDPGNYSLHIADSNLSLTQLDLGAYYKSDDSLAWLEDQSSLVFEASPKAETGSRIIVAYNLNTKNITELTPRGVNSTDPKVSRQTIVFQRADSAANPVSVWQWHKMALDGSGDTDLGVNAGLDATIRGDKLIVSRVDGGFLEVDVASKKQSTIQFDGLITPSSTESGLTTLSDGRLVFTYKTDNTDRGPDNRLGIVDLEKKTMTVKDNDDHFADPFETNLFGR